MNYRAEVALQTMTTKDFTSGCCSKSSWRTDWTPCLLCYQRLISYKGKILMLWCFTYHMKQTHFNRIHTHFLLLSETASSNSLLQFLDYMQVYWEGLQNFQLLLLTPMYNAAQGIKKPIPSSGTLVLNHFWFMLPLWESDNAMDPLPNTMQKNMPG